MTSLKQENSHDVDVEFADVRPSEVAAARLKLVTSERLGQVPPKWVQKLAKAEPRHD